MRVIWNSLGWLTLMILLVLTNGSEGFARQIEFTEHQIRPGDTWQATSWHHHVQMDVLRVDNGVINPFRQPTIGSSIRLRSNSRTPTNGRVVIVKQGSLLRAAVENNKIPWVLALASGLDHPWQPILDRKIFVPGGQSPPSEFPAGFETLNLFPDTPKPGRTLSLSAEIENVDEIKISLGSLPVPTYRNGKRLVGLIGTGAFLEPTDYELAIDQPNHPIWAMPVRLFPGDWEYEAITLTGDAAAIDQESIRLERERLQGIWANKHPQPRWSNQWILPIKDYLSISSSYGVRRSYNGGPYASYHEGVDFSAYGGTPVFATADGSVALAERLYVRGGAVIIDHGLGIFSGYYHLSEVLVEQGQFVSQGERIGSVGTTGLSTGNHLHWDLLVGGIWVDAAAWIEAQYPCWLLDAWGQPCPDF